MTYSDYRRVARENLQGNWGHSIFVSFVAAILGGLITGSSFFNINIDADVLETLPRFLVQYVALAGSIAGFLSLVRFIIGGTIQLGYTQYLLSQYNHAHCDIHDLFEQFHRFKDGFLQNLLRGLYVALWSLLFIIPGIVKSFSYAMTPFIMAETPNLTAGEAIEASKQLMDGHKGALFMLDLTFIGWDILSMLTLNIGYIFLNPYRNAAYAAFYKDLTSSRTNH